MQHYKSMIISNLVVFFNPWVLDEKSVTPVFEPFLKTPNFASLMA